jgi:hypothetical protein
VLGAVTALGALGTGAAFLVFYTLIERVGATNTTLVTYLIPLVAVIAGAVVLGERLGLAALVGGVLIVGGVWLAQRGTRTGIEPRPGPRRPRRPGDPEGPDAAVAEGDDAPTRHRPTTSTGCRTSRLPGPDDRRRSPRDGGTTAATVVAFVAAVVVLSDRGALLADTESTVPALLPVLLVLALGGGASRRWSPSTGACS